MQRNGRLNPGESRPSHEKNEDEYDFVLVLKIRNQPTEEWESGKRANHHLMDARSPKDVMIGYDEDHSFQESPIKARKSGIGRQKRRPSSLDSTSPPRIKPRVSPSRAENVLVQRYIRGCGISQEGEESRDESTSISPPFEESPQVYRRQKQSFSLGGGEIIRMPAQLKHKKQSLGGGLVLEDDWTNKDLSDPLWEKKKAKAEQRAVLEAKEMARAMTKYGWDHECGMVYARLRRCGLKVKRVQSPCGCYEVLKCRAPVKVLEEKAEQIRLLLPRKKCYGGAWEPFTRHKKGLFRPQGFSTSKRGKLFSSSQRQFLIEHIITARITDGGADLMMRGMTLSHSPLLRVVVQRFPLHMEQRLEDLRRKWLFRCSSQKRSIFFCCSVCGYFLCSRCCTSMCRSQSTRDVDDEDNSSSSSAATISFSPGGNACRKKKRNKNFSPWYSSPERRSSEGSDIGNDAASPRGFLQYVSSSAGREELSYYDSTESEEDDDSNSVEGSTPRSATMSHRSISITGGVARRRHRRFHPTSNRYHQSGRCCSRLFSFLLQQLFGQPLDDIAQYFGERVAFYFAYVEFYTRWLALPALVGALLFAYQARQFLSQFREEKSDEEDDNIDLPDVGIDTNLHIVWAAFLACWATGMLVYWRQRENDLAYRWGTMKCEEVETCRPQYYGDLQKDPDTREWVKVYPTWKRALKFLVTYTLVLTLLFLFGRATWAYHQWREFKLQEWVDGVNAALLEEYENSLGVVDPTVAPPEQVSLYVFSASEFKDHMQYWQWWTFMFVLPFGYGMSIPAINIVTMKVSLLFNQWENHETESIYQKHMIVKVFLFRFVVVFSSLIYYAFSPLLSAPHKDDFVGSNDGDDSVGSSGGDGNDGMPSTITNQGEASYQLGLQVFLLMLGGFAYSMLSAFVLPYVVIAWKGCMFQKQVNQLPVRLVGMWPYLHPGEIRKQMLDAHSQVWVECQLPEYEPFKDYTEILVQFGYVTFFSVAFPLAPLLAFLFNIVEIRADAHKLCYVKQRPLARKASGIGVWYSCIWFILVLSVFTNCALIYLTRSEGQTGNNVFHRGISGRNSKLFLFIYEHMLILMLFLGGNSFPVRSQWLRRAEKRDRHRAEKWQKSQAIMSAEWKSS